MKMKIKSKSIAHKLRKIVTEGSIISMARNFGDIHYEISVAFIFFHVLEKYFYYCPLGNNFNQA